MLFPAVPAEARTIIQQPAPALKPGYETILLTEDEAGVRRYVKRIPERRDTGCWRLPRDTRLWM
jgi:hypothetical protein